MADSKIRELERRAVSGDIHAAVQLYYEQLKHGIQRRHDDDSYPEVLVTFNELIGRRYIHGSLFVTPLSHSHIRFSPNYGLGTTSEFNPVYINNIPYRLSGRVSYHDGTWDLQDNSGESHLHLSRTTSAPSGEYMEPSVSAFINAEQLLLQLATKFAESHPEEMRQAALLNINDTITRIVERHEDLLTQLQETEMALGQAIITELKYRYSDGS